jgi:hypothetical protein
VPPPSIATTTPGVRSHIARGGYANDSAVSLRGSSATAAPATCSPTIHPRSSRTATCAGSRSRVSKPGPTVRARRAYVPSTSTEPHRGERTKRTFPRHDELALFAAVYDDSGSGECEVMLGSTVLAADGRVVHETKETIDPARRFHSAPLRAESRGAVEHRKHTPGDPPDRVHRGALTVTASWATSRSRPGRPAEHRVLPSRLYPD